LTSGKLEDFLLESHVEHERFRSGQKMGDDKKKEDESQWDCICGNKVKLSKDLLESGKEFCPECGEPVGDPSIVTPADTQTVNIREMARIAQEGIGVGISGEWDVSKEAKPSERSTRKK
jgi:hypothetical protein